MNLKQIAAAAATIQPNHSVLIYGPPKSGKTKLVGTAARLSEVKKIWWFDLENGVETLLHMGLTDEELEKIIVFKPISTTKSPKAIETMLKAFTSKTPVKICDAHGIVDCIDCHKAQLPSVSFYIGGCKHDELVVIDSGSELGNAALAATMLGMDSMAKPGWDEYGVQGKWLSDILSVVQQARNTNFVMITHEIALEDDQKKDRIFPLCGTKNYSMQVAKYFGTVIYAHKHLGKHVAGSGSTYKNNVLTGSRLNAEIEKKAEPDMRTILIEGGILSRLTDQRLDTHKGPVAALANVLNTPNVNTATLPTELTFVQKIAAKKAAAAAIAK